MTGRSRTIETNAPPRLEIANSITDLKESNEARVAVVASHGGDYTARYALFLGVIGLLCNDAGFGLNEAGVRGLAIADQHGIPAAAVDHLSARIGHGEDVLDTGIVSAVNVHAGALGVSSGMSASDAAEALLTSRAQSPIGAYPQDRRQRANEGTTGRAVWLLDSASLTQPSDVGSILVTGSHGGLLGGRSEAALRVDAHAAAFNDAGGGPDGRGIERIFALDIRGIAAVTVSHLTGEIGNARSMYETAIISALNETATGHGITKGMPLRDFVRKLST